jgi:hypothetical protein
MISTPNQIIILVPEASVRWLGGSKKTTSKKTRNPRRPLQPIPSHDPKELRERVARYLRHTQLQREQLKALAH